MGHVGDSGAFVIRDGKARRLTRDHKPTDPKEAKRIEEAGGKVHTALNRVYSADKGTLLAMSRCCPYTAVHEVPSCSYYQEDRPYRSSSNRLPNQVMLFHAVACDA